MFLLRRARLAVLPLVLLLLLGSCTYGATQVVVTVDTDVPANELLFITATLRTGSRVDGAGNSRTWSRRLADGGVVDAGARNRSGIALPATFTLTPNESDARNSQATLVVEAQVMAAAGQAPITFRRIARFAFSPRQTTALTVYLSRACGAPATGCSPANLTACTVGVRCEESGMTCGERGVCISRDTMPTPIDPPGMDGSTRPGDGARTDASCPASCPGGPNATGTCMGGVCILRCETGFADCDGAAANGCETDTRTSAMHCGMCGRGCGMGMLCASGTCMASCPAGQTACGASCVTTATDAMHCGGCGRACPVPANGSATCAAGACGVRCNPGFADCDGMPGNGCETDLNASATSCGMCGRGCTGAPNAMGACAAGACGLACNAGFANCDGTPDNGCEVDLSASTSHCGMCNSECPPRPNAAAACAAGVCGFRCNAGFADCDGMVANGCETDIRSSTSHCGMCGNACPSRPNASPACSGGTCGITCSGSWFNVDGTLGNGCECMGDTNGTACGGPTDLGTVGVGGGRAAVGNVVPAGDSDWFAVTFAPGGNARIRLTTNPGAHFIEVAGGCSGGPFACPDRTEGATGITDWEFFDTPAAPPHRTRNVTFPTTVRFRVYTTGAATCGSYTVTVSN